MTAARLNIGTTDRPLTVRLRVWIGCLGCYNDGQLVGDWFDARNCPTDGEALSRSGVQVPSVHNGKGHEEVWVFDHEGFGGVLTGEASPKQARHLVELITNAQDRGLPVEALAYWLNDAHEIGDIEVLLDELSDAYCGKFDSGADYAQQLADDVCAIPTDQPWPLPCIDWAHAWRELELGGDNWAIRAGDGGYLVFRSV